MAPTEPAPGATSPPGGHAPPRVSVVVRARDEAAAIGAALASVRAQTVPSEIVVVDSGSTDGTVELARAHADRLIEIAPGSFTFGGSLNTGTEAATGDVVVALSAHCTLPRTDWIERALGHFADPHVAAVFGEAFAPDGAPLDAPVRATWADVATDPRWGYTNHAGAFRRSAWAHSPFDPAARSCEDKQFMWRLLEAGLDLVADPGLVVGGGHRRAAGARALWARVEKEHHALARMLDYPPVGAAGWAQRWWGDMRWPSRYPTWVRRASPGRAVEHLAAAVGERRGVAERDATTITLPST